MDPRHVLVTGATGFVGAALVAELLEQTDARVTCLVRSRPGIAANDRLHRHLRQTIQDYGLTHLDDTLAERVTAAVGDVTDPKLARIADDVEHVDAIWHSAASLKYRDNDAAEIRLHNVEGTRHVVELAHALRATEFNHISTAYVAGRRSGLIAEHAVPHGTVTNNQYEQSKIDAEELVAESGLRVRMFRPSIVIGHSRTRRADSDAGVYGFLREMERFVSSAGDPSALPTLRIAAHTDTGLNLIPVDTVASSAVAISMSPSPSEYFHLTNNHTALVRDAIPMVCEELGLPAPTFTDDAESLSREDRLLNRYLDFYLPYLGGERSFDRTNTDAVVGHRCDHPIGPDEQRAIVVAWRDNITAIPEPAAACSS